MATHQSLDEPIAISGPERLRPAWLTRRLIWSLVAGVVLIAGGVIALALNWPFTEQALIDVLQERTVRSVTIDRFRTTYFPPGCFAEGIKFLRRKHKDKPPLITISRVEVRGSYWGMISPRKHLPSVRVYGMHVIVPPSDPNGGRNPIMPVTKSQSGRSITIGTVLADGAVLEFLQRTPRKPSVRIVVHRLALDGVGNDRPLTYRAVIENPIPPATIESSGQFGTWNPDDPPQTPVKGWYRFMHGNLGAFKAISGMLASEGSFDGTLGRLEVRGKADVPRFYVSGSSHARELTADLRATVNATDGNVILDDVVARFDRTTVRFNGAVEGYPGKNGKAVSLEMTSGDGRIEDILNLFIEAKRSPISGNFNFLGRFELPPERTSFLTDMSIQSAFGVGSGKFANREIQSSLSRISEDAARKDHLPLEDAETLVSNLQGRVKVENGVANLTDLALRVPGAEAAMKGTFNLVNFNIDLHGSLMTDGSASVATTGFKSFLLKAVTPFLKKTAGRQTIPFKITGNYQKVEVGLDIGHKN